jgi:ABC-2 type transport system ATP-binding protein
MFHELAAAGTTLLVSSHVMDEAERCQDLVLLRDGRVLATGSPEELRRRTGQDDLGDAFLALAEAE